MFPHADLVDADYNIVQNNGEGADQVVPHVHFHVVPRPRDHYQLLDHQGRERYTRRPPGEKALAFMFGRGGRAELVETKARALMVKIKGLVREEWERELGGVEEWRRVRRERTVELSRRGKQRPQLRRRAWRADRRGPVHPPRRSSEEWYTPFLPCFTSPNSENIPPSTNSSPALAIVLVDSTSFLHSFPLSGQKLTSTQSNHVHPVG